MHKYYSHAQAMYTLYHELKQTCDKWCIDKNRKNG